MTRKLILVMATGGTALLGAILIYGSGDHEDTFAEILKTQEQIVASPSPTSLKKLSPARTPAFSLSPSSTENIDMSTSPSPSFTENLNISISSSPIPTRFYSASPTASPTELPVPSATATTMVTQNPTPLTQKSTDHIFYTSSHWKAKYYYCDTDNGWKDLSPTYLKSFNSEEELLKNYSRILHEPCK